MNGQAPRKQLAENLRVLRLMRGWSQDELAEAAGLDRSYVSGIERAERNLSLGSLEKLAQAFGITIPDLLIPCDPQEVGEQVLVHIRKHVKITRK